jgi:STE24 endopeptidase
MATLAVAPAILAFRHWGVAIHTLGLMAALAFPCGLIASGAWRSIQQGLRRWIGDRPVALAAMGGGTYGLAWSLVSDLVQLALRMDRQAFGFEDQTWPSWLAERAASTATLVLAGLIVAPLGYALMARSPRRWPIWGGLMIAGVLVGAVVAQPLFTNNQALPPGPLKAQIDQMLRKAGHPGAPVVLHPRSGPCVGGTNLGAFPTTQIVIDDGYLNYPASQGVEVAAHELGHYVRHDPELGVLVGLAWLSIGCGAMYCASQMVSRPSSGAVPTAWPLIPAMIFCATLVYVAGLPAFNLIQRRIEHRADQYAMELTRDGPAGVAGMLRDLSCDHLDPQPGWWARTLFWNHPTIAERIDFMRRYEPAAAVRR